MKGIKCLIDVHAANKIPFVSTSCYIQVSIINLNFLFCKALDRFDGNSVKLLDKMKSAPEVTANEILMITFIYCRESTVERRKQ